MLKIPITKTAPLFLVAVLMPSASIAIEDCGTSVTECRMKQQIEDLQRQNKTQQGQITELQTALSSLRQKMNAMAFPPLHFLNCGGHYQCTPKMCLEKCISLGLRMATYDEVYAWASQGNDHCVRMWMLDSQHLGQVYASYPMYKNNTNPGCGTTNTGNIPRMEWIGVTDWNSEDKWDCACAGIR
jgi:hypothetical protein